MKNYFKSYYKTRLTQGILGEHANELIESMKTDALTQHKNIMEGYAPAGRESGILNPESRADYLKHFTSFIKEQFHLDEMDWKGARNIHNAILEGKAPEILVESNGSDYVSRFTEFMNTPSTRIILENALIEQEVKAKELRENKEDKKESPASFVDSVIHAVRQHVKNPGKTISSSRGDNFDVLDHAQSAAEHIQYHMKHADKVTPHEKGKHQDRIAWLKSVLPDEVVDRLIEKHFKGK